MAKKVTKVFDEQEALELQPDPNNPCEVPELREHYAFSMKQVAFLEEYKVNLDLNKAANHVGVRVETLNKWLKLPHINEVIYKINKTYADAVLLDSKVAAGRFINTFDKIEKRFDEGDGRVAGALANMASNMLKATGHFSATDGAVGTQVNINIDLSGATNVVQSDDETIEVKAVGR